MRRFDIEIFVVVLVFKSNSVVGEVQQYECCRKYVYLLVGELGNYQSDDNSSCKFLVGVSNVDLGFGEGCCVVYKFKQLVRVVVNESVV